MSTESKIWGMKPSNLASSLCDTDEFSSLRTTRLDQQWEYTQACAGEDHSMRILNIQRMCIFIIDMYICVSVNTMRIRLYCYKYSWMCYKWTSSTCLGYNFPLVSIYLDQVVLKIDYFYQKHLKLIKISTPISPHIHITTHCIFPLRCLLQAPISKTTCMVFSVKFLPPHIFPELHNYPFSLLMSVLCCAVFGFI